MIAYFFTFNKKTLSTKVPTQTQYTSGIAPDITLLDSTSILTPSIRLKLSTSPVAYNYCYIPEFSRYYRVNNWTSNRDMWTCDLECDLLASFKSDIIASTQYVMRSASNYDLNILDSFYPTKTDFTTAHNVNTTETLYSANSDVNDPDNIVASITTLGGSDSLRNISEGGANFYLLNASTLDSIMDYLCVNYANFLDATDISVNTQKLIFNPFDYITSIKIYPFLSLGNFTDELNANHGKRVRFGYWEMQSQPGVYILGIKKTFPIYHVTHNIPLDAHPQAASRGNKMNGSGYTKRILHFEPFGDIELDATKLEDCIGISCHISLDLLSGGAKLQIKGYDANTDLTQDWNFNSHPVIFCDHANLAYEVPIVNMVPSKDFGSALPVSAGLGILKGANSVGEAVKAFGGDQSFSSALGNITGDIIGGGGSFDSYSVVDAINATQTELHTKGGGGTRLPCYLGNPFVDSFFFPQVEENLLDHGRPLCRRVVLSSLSGYCACMAAELPISGTKAEQKAIETILNSGFYIE